MSIETRIAHDESCLPDWERELLSNYTFEAAGTLGDTAGEDSYDSTYMTDENEPEKQAAQERYMRTERPGKQDHGTRGPWENRRGKDPHWPYESMPRRKLIGQIAAVDINELPEVRNADTNSDISYWADAQLADADIEGSLWETPETFISGNNNVAEAVDEYQQLALEEAGQADDFGKEFSSILQCRLSEQSRRDTYDGDAGDYDEADWMDGFHITDRP